MCLTVAHLDNDVTNNDYQNLRALCQRCHNIQDKDYRLANRTRTIYQKKHLNQFLLFEAEMQHLIKKGV